MQDHRFIHWLKSRGITENVLTTFGLSVYDHPLIGECIRIPVRDELGAVLFSKYRRDPAVKMTPKYIYDKGSSAFLYGLREAFNTKPDTLLITEGELDCLIAWSHNIPAVSSTGGAMTWNEDFTKYVRSLAKKILICYDNDDAGASGMVRVLSFIPEASVVFVPERPGIKDITDYVAHGGNLNELIRTAHTYTSLEEVQEDRARRISIFDSVRFHDAYIKAHEVVEVPHARPVSTRGVKDMHAVKQVPIPSILRFVRGKALCPWHNESTPSLHYYESTNTVHCFGCSHHGDVIDVYRAVHGCTFSEAVAELKKKL